MKLIQGLCIILVGTSLIHCGDKANDDDSKREKDYLATQNAALQNQVASEKAKNEASSKQLQALTATQLPATDLQAQIDSLKNDTNGKVAEIEAQKAEIEALKASTDALAQDKVKLLEEQLKAKESAVSEQQTLITRLEEAQKQKAELEALKASDDAMAQGKIKALEEQVKASEAAVADQAAVVAGLKAAADAKSNELAKVFKGSISPYAGIWLLDPKPELSFPNCQYLVRFDADQGSVYRAVICSDGKIQAERQNVIGFGADNSSGWSGTLGFKMLTTSIKSSCADPAGLFASGTSYGFDHSVGTASAANEASLFMKASIGSDQKNFKSGSSIPDLGKNKSCSGIITRSQMPSQAGNTLLQEAAKVCQLTPELTGTGCFKGADIFEPSL